MTTNARFGALSTPLTLVPSTNASAAGPRPRARRNREQLLSIVGIVGAGEKMVAWVSETARTVLGMSGQEFVWGRYSVDDSTLGDPAFFDLAAPGRRGSGPAIDGRLPGGVVA